MERVELSLLLIFTLSLYCSRAGSEGCLVEERDALLDFKQSLFDPDLLLSNWKIGEDCCTWNGVSCSNKTNHVIKLGLSMPLLHMFGNLSATSLCPSLFRLRHLKYLCLSSILFNQTRIPHSIGSLTNLHHLDLSSSGFIGVIPPQLGNLTNLRYLDLSGNSLVAFNLLWISRLISLEYLDMSYVNLTSATNWLHEIKVLPALSYLCLSFCNLQTLPTLHSYPYFSSTIKTFDLSVNHLSGSLPNWLGQFKSLKKLYLYSNYFNGPISFVSSSLLCNLQYLDLRYNNFTKLSDGGSTSKCNEYKMKEMYISNNQLNGSIPEWVGEMKILKILDLENNQLNGLLPQSIGQLTNLVYLNLQSNNLQGSLSEVHFANLSQLKYLDLSHNHLNFKMIRNNWIPPFQIYELHLSSCFVGPQFPLWLQNQKLFFLLDLSNCGISDIIPSWLWNTSSQIDYLNMSQNAIKGELPLLLNFSIGATIDLKSNQLEGSLPRPTNRLSYVSFSNNKFSSGIDLYLNASMSWLEVLVLSQNHLSGEIPNSICQMPLIVFLDLSDNSLSGEIPKCNGSISSFVMLQIIRISNNNFVGSIPQWIGNLPMLFSLHLNKNFFQGEIPFFNNCRELIILDLGENNLTGKIPLWFGDKLVSLKFLRLRSNKLYGSIPSELSKLRDLQFLDLADNFLSGSIPKSFKFFNSMTVQQNRLEPLIPDDDVHYFPRLGDLSTSYFIQKNTVTPDSLLINIKGTGREFKNTLSLVNIIDLSCNNLTGEVPIELMSLFGLISLNLSRNQFTGQIPINIGVMKSLEGLDLSWNHFSDEIPESIVQLSKLSYLNLSYNQLSGRIPEGTQLDTFNESSYYGNLKLCGEPLIKTCEGDEHKIHNEGGNSQDDDDFGLFLSMGLGFAVGLWSVLGTLLLKRSWSISYFQFLDNMTNNTYVFVIVKVNQWLN